MRRWAQLGCVLLLAAGLAAHPSTELRVSRAKDEGQQAGAPAPARPAGGLAEWAPDGKLLIAGSGLLARFDLDSSAETLLDRGVDAFAFSPDGARLVLGGRNRLELRSYPELQPQTAPQLPSGTFGTAAITALAWSGDGQTLTAGTATGHVLLWDLEDNELWADLNVAPASAVARLRFSADARRLLTAFADGRAILWDLERREEVHRYAALPPDAAGAVAAQTITDLAADGGLVLATRTPEQGEPEMLLVDDRGAVRWTHAGYGVEFARDPAGGPGAGVLALVPPFRLAALYAMRDAAPLRVFEPPEAVRTLYLVRQSPDGKLLVGVGEDHQGQVLVLWDFSTAEVLKTRR